MSAVIIGLVVLSAAAFVGQLYCFCVHRQSVRSLEGESAGDLAQMSGVVKIGWRRE